MHDQRLRAVVLDWAGTTVDHGSIAPVKALEQIFNQHGIVLPQQTIRRYMGLAKKDHVRKLLAEAETLAQWQHMHAAPPSDADVDALYACFAPQMMELLPEYSAVIEGVPEAIAQMRSRGLQIGGTTGYTRPMLDQLIAAAAQQGFETDTSMCPEDAGAGRPAPWMC